MTKREGYAWAAGFVDGEGHFRVALTRIGGKVYAGPRLVVSQVDRRHLETLQNALGLGVIAGPYKRKGRKERDYYHFRIQNFEEFQAAVCFMWPFLGKYRRKQALQALKTCKKFKDAILAKNSSEGT